MKADRAKTSDAELLARLAEIVGEKGVITDPAELAPHLADRRGRYVGSALALVKPASTAEVAAVVRLAARDGRPIVPQGGNTGLVGGSVPYEDDRALVVNLARMNRIRALDHENDTITVEAGCLLAAIQEAAGAAERLFPLSLGAEGSCQIGGNLSTNAGGVQVLRYGNARELVLGLEVVLADGAVWDGLRGLRKDNTGYDLKQLFLGAEGTLGIITAAVLKLFPAPKDRATALIALADTRRALDLLERTKARAGETLTSFELMPRRGFDFAFAHVARAQDPFVVPHPWYVLVELTSADPEGHLRGRLEAVFAEAFEAGVARDGVLAESEARRQDLWLLREAIVEAQLYEGGSIKHDVSVPISQVPAFLDEALATVEALIPGVRPVPFGHLGDGNIHFNMSQPLGADRAAFLARWDEVNRLVHDIVVRHRGSISAEHGIGRLKLAENRRLKDPLELALMARIKRALDPQNIMNPGKVVDS
jgi:FAD/FMN-containing dehydrogenase